MYAFNNTLSNRQTNRSTRFAYSFYRTATTGPVYSDFNNLYTNTTGAGDALHGSGYYGGTICYQLSDWRTAGGTSGMDQHSIAELAPWLASDSLHVSTSTATRIESA